MPRKQITPSFLELLFVFFEVSFEKPEDKNVLIFFQLTPFEGSIVTLSLCVGDDEHGISIRMQNIIHEESRDPAVSISKWVDGDEFQMNKSCKMHGMKLLLVLVIPVKKIS